MRRGREEKSREEKMRREEKKKEVPSKKKKKEERREKRKTEERRRSKKIKEEKNRRKKIQVREKGRKVAKPLCFPMICGSGGWKCKLAQAAGAKPFGQMRDEQLHCCGTKRVSKSKVKKRKTHQGQTTFGSWDVEKRACRFGAKHISKSKVEKTDGFEVRMSFCVAGARNPALCWQWVNCEGSVAISTARPPLHYIPLRYTTATSKTTATAAATSSTTLHCTTLLVLYKTNYTTLPYTTPSYFTLHYATITITTTTTISPQYATQR